MNELVERYIHQVGRYVPSGERKEIESELRSQILDQLEDRYSESASNDDVVAVLKEWGDPRTLAASYGGEQYLVGPDLYPTMMKTLRRGWVVIPSLVVLVQLIFVLLSGEQRNVIGLAIEVTFAILQGIIFFSAIVVAIFAVLQREGVRRRDKRTFTFNPLELPPVDDAASIDYTEATFGIAFGLFFTIVFVYFLRVGGLTLSFDLSNPGDVIPVSQGWLIALILGGLAQLLLQTFVLSRRRWTVPTQLMQMLLEFFSTIALYFVIIQPVTERLLMTPLSNLPMTAYLAEMVMAAIIIMLMLSEVPKLFRMLRTSRT